MNEVPETLKNLKSLIRNYWEGIAPDCFASFGELNAQGAAETVGDHVSLFLARRPDMEERKLFDSMSVQEQRKLILDIVKEYF